MTTRKVPVTTQIKLLFGGAKQAFYLLFLFGIFFAWGFNQQADLSLFSYLGAVENTEGSVFEVYETNASVGERSVYAYNYRFIDDQGNEWEDVSFSTGKRYSKGSSVAIEYPQGKPKYSRIKGLRRSQFSPWMLLMYLLPASAIGFLIYNFKKSLLYIKLFRQGILTEGRLIEKTATNTSINDQTVYKLTFMFKANNGQEYLVTEKTHQVDSLLDDEKEPLLYDEARPDKATLLDHLPGNVEINDETVGSVGVISSFISLILPALSVVAVLYIYG